ncbi:hypothetical protein SCOR_31985 [Sulfidibacter corallicola]|uniref:Uncharacterized protein n=1 Tax=Sulfidibacter corallicola TaxID=2818388 RepID=A0A8A4TKV5_SULCO|nr:hypothetical protein [Sulfidibacter corallicola]QTD49834.1 hypothetical protein J3U87_29990 [Sulfidibacter corallicola]
MNWEKIKNDVEKNGNIQTFSMEQLRNAHGVAKLGVRIRKEISDALAGIGLGHVPMDLPSFQHEQVRLYKRGTKIGDLISMVLTPGEQNDMKLIEQFSEEIVEYQNIIQKIRELVVE